MATSDAEDQPTEATEDSESVVVETAEAGTVESADPAAEAVGSAPESEASGDSAEPVEGAEIIEEKSAVDLSETETKPVQEPAPVTVQRSGGFATFMGGIAAGAVGFLVATFLVPDGWPNGSAPDTTTLEKQVSEQSDRLAGLSKDLGELKASSGSQPGPSLEDFSGLDARFAELEGGLPGLTDAVEQGLSGLEAKLADLDARIAELEARPQGPVTPDGSAAMEAQLEAFRQQLDQVTADAEDRIAEARTRASEIEAAAEAARKQAARSAALSSLKTALDDGTPFSETLASFPEAPEALKSAASEGVPTLSDLQSSFPSAARTALSLSHTVPDDASTAEKFAAFLRRQTNARSLAPREGDDTDAILSRAEAALADGDLETALTELSALPDDAQNAMSDWITSTQLRAAALASVSKLETQTN